MKFLSSILLFGIFHWTLAALFPSGPCLLEIDEGLLKNVNLRTNTSDIRITGWNFTAISENAFDTLKHIKTLDLSNNSIIHLAPHIFSNLTNLEELSLADNNLQTYENCRIFVGLSTLKRVNLSGNYMPNLYSEFFIGLSNSAEVIIEEANFKTFRVQEGPPQRIYNDPEESEKCHEALDIKVKLCQISGTVESLSELEENETLDTDCIEVPVYHEDCLIDLSNLGLKKFNHNWYKLADHNVEEIDLSYNLLEDVTPELLNNLMVPLKINLRGNNISIIKKNIMENEHCMRLTLGAESFIAIEDDAFEKLCLTELIVSGSTLKNLNFIRILSAMITRLELDHNKISKIPSGLFQNLHKLVGLDLRGNQIKKITDNTFTGLRSRSTILLADNEIEYIEEGSFSHLNLDLLDLSNNHITDESIRRDAFNQSVISFLLLEGNQMTMFDGELFSGLLGMSLISFYNNPIECMKNLNYREEILHSN